MCVTCGCDTASHHQSKSHEELHALGIAHHHHAEDETGTAKMVDIEKNILDGNNAMAERNRGYLEAKQIYCLNMVSSPGAGKTTLLEHSLKRLSIHASLGVIEGDQQTSNDADRIALTGTPCIQINTQNGCHLDAIMVNRALKRLNPAEHAILFIENVGNLVCPALFDLGEDERVVLVCTTEGEDKPLKYPFIFESASVCVITKIDLLPYLSTDMELLRKNIREINPHARIFELSAQSGEGMNEWCDYLLEQLKKKQQ